MLGNSIKESIKNQFLLDVSNAKNNKTESKIREAFKDLFLKMKGSSVSTATFEAVYVGCQSMQRFLFDVFSFGCIQQIRSVSKIDEGYWQQAIVKSGSKELVTVDDIRNIYVSNGIYVPRSLSRSSMRSKIAGYVEEPLKNLFSASSLALLSNAAAAIDNGNSYHCEPASNSSSNNNSMLLPNSNFETSIFHKNGNEKQENNRNRCYEEASSKSNSPIQKRLRLFTARQKAIIKFLKPLLNQPSLSKNKKGMDTWNSAEVLAFIDETNVDESIKSKFRKYCFVDGASLRLIVDHPVEYGDKFFSEQLQLDEQEKMKIINAVKLQCDREASKTITNTVVENDKNRKRTLSSIIADLKTDQKIGSCNNNKRRKTKK